ncbi:MAG: hypothetical protein WC582_01375, partial [Patescibacteria group bacterium]
MRKKDRKLNFLSVRQEERSSRFVVDLKEVSGTEEVFAEKENKKENFWKQIEEKISEKNSQIRNKQNRWRDFYKNKLDQLAFLSLGKFIFVVIFWLAKWFYKLCYGLGWVLFFLVRLFSLIFAKFFSFVGAGVHKFYAGTKIIVQIFLRSLKDLFSQFFSEARKFLDIFNKIIRYPFNKFSRRKQEDISSPEAISEKEDEDFSPASFPPELKFSWKKSIAIFALALLVIILPFKIFVYYKSFNLESLKGKILGASETALDDLSAASQSATQLDFSGASDNFAKAGANFLEAQKQVLDINDVFFSLASLAPGGEIKLASEGKKILAAGQIASSLGENLSLAIKSLFESKDKDVLEILNSFTEYGKITASEAIDLDNKLKEIDINSLPAEYKDK